MQSQRNVDHGESRLDVPSWCEKMFSLDFMWLFVLALTNAVVALRAAATGEASAP